MTRNSLLPFAVLSIAAALATMGLKLVAWRLTGSVGLLSDALESLVNLGGAIMALLMLRLAAMPADTGHPHGHSKAEYFSSGFEGLLIFIAGGAILVPSVHRLIQPQPLEQAGIGIAVSAVAAVVNLVVSRVLAGAARRHHSPALKAEAAHLLTDVWTSGGVILGVALVVVTGWNLLDPLIALAVALHILWTGARLVREAFEGLMDAAWPADEREVLDEILAAYRADGVGFHAIRTRRAAARRFVSFHVLVPGTWSVKQGHDLLERIEAELSARLPYVHVLTHLEPLEDPASYADEPLDRCTLVDSAAEQGEDSRRPPA